MADDTTEEQTSNKDSASQSMKAIEKQQKKTAQKTIDYGQETKSPLIATIFAVLAVVKAKMNIKKAADEIATREEAKKLAESSKNLQEDAKKALKLEETPGKELTLDDDNDEALTDKPKDTRDYIQELKDLIDHDELTPEQEKEAREFLEKFEQEQAEFDENAETAHETLDEGLDATAAEREQIFSEIIARAEESSPPETLEVEEVPEQISAEPEAPTEDVAHIPGEPEAPTDEVTTEAAPTPKPGSHRTDDEQEKSEQQLQEAELKEKELDQKVEDAEENYREDQHKTLDKTIDQAENQLMAKHQEEAKALTEKFELENKAEAEPEAPELGASEGLDMGSTPTFTP